MGNLQDKNTVSKVDRENVRQPEPYAPEKHEYGNPSGEQMTIASNTAVHDIRRSIISGTDIDTSLLKSGMLRNNAGDMCDNCHNIHRKAAGKAVDPRLLTILEFFRQLYVRRQEVFKRSFPDLHDKFDDLLKKDGVKLSQVKSGRMKVQPMQRSLSVGSPREISRDDLKLERFKVRTIDVGGDVKVQGGKGGQDDKTKGGGSK